MFNVIDNYTILKSTGLCYYEHECIIVNQHITGLKFITKFNIEHLN